MNSLGSMVSVIRPSGALITDRADAFKNELLLAISNDAATELVVDMSQVDALDSNGLICLMTALNAAKSLSKGLSLYAVPPSIRIVFELAQLDQALRIVDRATSTEAIAA